MEEETIGLIIREEKTGHQYYGTSVMAYESVDNCGTCDGARCGNCKTKYIVEDFETEEVLYSGYNKDEAEEVYNIGRKVENAVTR